MSAANSRPSRSSQQEFDRAEPVLLLAVWLQIIFAVRAHDSRSPRFSGSLRQKLAIQGRYKVNLFLCVLTGSLQGIAERPLPCSYNVIPSVIALSRRKRGFKSRRGTPTTSITYRNPFRRVRYWGGNHHWASRLIATVDANSIPIRELRCNGPPPET